MLKTNPEPNYSGGNTTKKGEPCKEPKGRGRCQLNLAIQHASDHAVLDSKLDSLRHLGRPDASRLHLGQIRFCHSPFA